ncbi:flagellar motor protein MotA [bacterium endosymbiont of Escarpia laminata]|nr:MAG: flagellar motor protein MotA [bacterium endosymbiont of Escarpia laminata]
MKRLLLPLFILMLSQSSLLFAAKADSLESLLQQVRESRQLQKHRDTAREQRFLEQRDQRQSLLDEAKQALAAARQKKLELDQRYTENQGRLIEDRAQLKEKSGTLGELFGSVRQVASESRNIFGASLISVERPQDLLLLDELAGSQKLPSIEKLEALWQLFLERLVEAGKIKRFETPVITSDGVEQIEMVTRIGLFNAISNGRYLRYLPESGRLMALGRQPTPRFQLMAKKFETAEETIETMAIDPSRGAILSLLVQSPTLLERIRQGGVIGYIIIGLGAVGILLTLERLILLFVTGRRVKKQIGNRLASGKNPLGRLMLAMKTQADSNAEALQLRSDEAILKELPALRRGLPMLGILAAVAPLLGLLGTVTGMIETFQSITLFGTGDPKLMSGGISQALVTTELGLAVAIPLVLLHSYLSGRSNRLIQILDEQSAALVAHRAEISGTAD